MLFDMEKLEASRRYKILAATAPLVPLRHLLPQQPEL